MVSVKQKKTKEVKNDGMQKGYKKNFTGNW